MRRLVISGLACAPLLAACLATPPGKAPDAGGRPSTGPGIKATATPGAGGKGTPGPTATPDGQAPAPANAAVLLAAPGTRKVAGTVSLDAAYALAHGATAAAGAGGARTLRLPGPAAVIANNGGNIIANNGSGVLSLAGGGVISDYQAGILGKIRFSVRQAAAPPTADAPAPGTMWPAAGMALYAMDLATGKPIPIGQDADAKPVYVIITNAEGGYAAYLPATGADRVRLVAAPPEAGDRRLVTAALALDAGERRDLDEDTAQVASYIREIYIAVLRTNVNRLPSEVKGEGPGWADLTPAEIADAVPKLVAMLEAFQRAKVGARPPAEIEAILRRMADLALARVPLSEARMPGSGKPALAETAGLVRRSRERMAALMARELAAGRDPQVLIRSRPWYQEANAGRAQPIEILKPSDFSDFATRAYLVNPELSELGRFAKLAELANDPNFPAEAADDLPLFADVWQAFVASYMRAFYVGEAAAVFDEIKLLDGLPPAGAASAP